jgi:hypothetical protein
MTYAYEVPSNPHVPEAGVWATLVRNEPVRVGDRVALSQAEVVGDEIVIHDSGVEWEIVAIEPTANDGQPAVIRRKNAPTPIWSGRLIVRPAD